jgi:predicted nucleic acid-binding protein
MIVVSDTSPITALLTVDHSQILQSLFGQVVVTRLETEAGVYITYDLRERALRSVGE